MEAGLGTIVRGWVRALRAAGVGVGLRDVSELTVMRTEDTTVASTSTDTPYDINLVTVNADQHFHVKQFVGDGFFRDHYNIGVWFWELPTFPAEWHDRFASTTKSGPRARSSPTRYDPSRRFLSCTCPRC